MALSDTKIRTAKAKPKPYKLFDENGLFLLVTAAGGKLWRFKYRHGGKENLLALGSYPEMGLKEARKRRDEARGLLADGKDPNQEKKRKAVAATIAAANTFRAVSDEFLAKQAQEGLAERTINKNGWLASLLMDDLGDRPVSEIEPFEVLEALRRIERKGNHETAKRLCAFAARIFRYAITTSRARHNPAADLSEALVAPKVKHHAAILEPKALGALLRAIEDYEGHETTRLALRLAPHVFVRPGELRHAEWAEFDLDKAVWRIPAEKMKMRNEHVVPLSSQAIAIVREAEAVRHHSKYVFPAVRTWLRPMSENTLNAALRRMGYTTDEMTSHGFRSSASTLLNESGLWSSDAIERALAHSDKDSVRSAYHRGQHWDERVRMAQWWSDYLDKLRDGAEILSFKSPA